jgi:hypothetical protein
MKKILVPVSLLALAVACGRDSNPTSPTAPKPVGPTFDNIYNNIDATVDVVAEVMPLTVGGANRTTQLLVMPTGGDGKPGCNLTGSTTLVVSIASSNPAVATVSPASVTFTSCGYTETLTVTPGAQGTATITVAQTSNTTGGSFNFHRIRRPALPSRV